MAGYEIKVKSKDFTYRVLIEEGLLSGLGKTVRLLLPSSKALLVSDSTVFSLYGERVLKALKSEKWQVSICRVQPGEKSKTLTSVSKLYNAAVKAGLDRNSPVIALGGGVVGDLAGFAASTFMRGVPLVMVPTSLLAQVDSSVGGKVAVNHPRGKNLIGSFYPPRLVVIDPLVLNTLPARQLQAGLAEVIKYGIIENKEFFLWLEENIDYLLSGENVFLVEAISESVRAKARVVQADEYEKDYRRILNFGHTIGHALEAATDYSYYLHGEAVLCGMMLAVEISLRQNILDLNAARRIKTMLAKCGLKRPPTGLTAQKIIDRLKQDKKRREADFIFVLPSAIGSATIVPVNDLNLLKNVIELLWFEDWGVV